jgi:hypothetical protein
MRERQIVMAVLIVWLGKSLLVLWRRRRMS